MENSVSDATQSTVDESNTTNSTVETKHDTTPNTTQLKNFLVNFQDRNKQIKVAQGSTWAEVREQIAKKLQIDDDFVCRQKISIDSAKFDSDKDWQDFYLNAEDYDTIFVPNFSLDSSKIKLEKKLGAGSFGTAYSATFDGKPIAIKLFSPLVNDDALKKQLKIIEKLPKNEYLVEYLGFTRFPYKEIGIVMELMDSTLLNELKNNMVNNGGLKTDQKLECCVQIISGLVFLHKNGIIHRDLAARNCLIKGEFPDTICIKLSDFALPEIIEKSSEAAANNKLGILWVPITDYLAGTYSEAFDVWSFGVTMWEIFSNGENPYTGVIDIFEFLVTANQRLPKPEECTDEIYALMFECWNLDPTQRPSSQELLARIKKFQSEKTDF